jgi:hypothetical protein
MASQSTLQLHPQPMRSRASLSIQPMHLNTATTTPNGCIQPSLITQKTLFVG